MRRTPNIPLALRSFHPRDCPDKHDGCIGSRNVYELPGLEDEAKLFSSERMVFSRGQEVLNFPHRGNVIDWDCDALFLMQDAAPWDAIQERVVQHHPDPFSQRNFIEEPRAGGAQTNRGLHDLARHLRCRKLAGNAMIGILKPPGEYSTRDIDVCLMACPWIRGHCTRVLRWVIEEAQTPNLRLLACLGDAAFEFLSEALLVSKEVKRELAAERGSTATVGRVRLSYLWHPSRAPHGGMQRAEAAWRRMAHESGIPFLD